MTTRLQRRWRGRRIGPTTLTTPKPSNAPLRRAVHEVRNALTIVYGLLEQSPKKLERLHVDRDDLEAVQRLLKHALALMEAAA